MILIKLICFVIFYFISSDFLKFLPILLPVILAVAFFTVFERKILAAMQRRRGPMLLGYMGCCRLLLMG